MNLVLCSGNSLRNKTWIHEVHTQISQRFDKTYVQEYAHWDSGAEWIDLNHEQGVLIDAVEGMEPYGIFAKSIGTLLSVRTAAQDNITPRFMLLSGLPLEAIRTVYPDFGKALRDLKIPITIIHNELDTVGSGKAVKEYLDPFMSDNDLIRFIETPGDTHDYLDYELIVRELTMLNSVASNK